MFDRLVESTKNKQHSHSGRFLFLTGLIYAMLLTVLAVWTIMGFSPGLAESIDWVRFMPPVPINNLPARPVLVPERAVSSNIFRQPTGEQVIPRPQDVPELNHNTNPRLHVAGGLPGSGRDLLSGNYSPIFSGNGAPVPPPPAPKPSPNPTPEVKPTQKPMQQVSRGVIQGAAVSKPAPVYPAIAKQAGVQGAVQILVTISEEGRVIDTAIVSGHPLLRQAALEAARRWVFNPTTLSEVPVKVQGILTFNFTLN